MRGFPFEWIGECNTLLSLLSITIIFIGCQFHPDGDYFEQIEKPDFSGVDIYLDQNDNIVVYKPTTFKFIIDDNSQVLKRVEIFLDTTRISAITRNLTDTLSFEVDPTDFATGSYTLKVAYVAGPNNNSLGDILEFEEYTVWRELSIIINIEPPSSVEIDTIFAENGLLTVKWKAPEIINFKNYYLYGNGFSISVENDKSEAQFPRFVAGTIEFRIDCYSEYFHKAGTSKSFSLVEKLSAIELVDSNHVTLSWKKPTLYQNVEKIEVVRINGSTVESVAETAELGDNSILYQGELFFGSNYTFQTRFYYKAPVGVYQVPYYATMNEIALGDSIPMFDHMTYDKIFNKYFLKSELPENASNEFNYTIYRLNDQFSIEDQASFLEENNQNPTITASPDGKKIATVTHNSLKLLEFNSATMTQTRVTDIGKYMPSASFTRRGSAAKLTSNDLALVKTLGHTIILDSERERTLFSERTTIVGDNIDISYNGDFLYFSLSIYEFKGGSFQRKMSVNTERGFFIDDGNFLAVSDSGISEIDPKTGSIVNKFNFDSSDRLASLSHVFLDKGRDTFVLFKNNFISVYDYSTGTLSKRLPSSAFHGLYYLNGTFFSTNGRAIKYN